jgi:hypothetical protein
LPAWNRQSLSENGDHEEEVEFRYRGQSWSHWLTPVVKLYLQVFQLNEPADSPFGITQLETRSTFQLPQYKNCELS